MRKVLSFVLVLTLVMGSFSMAFAAPSATGLTDLDEQNYAAAANVLVDLGVVTGNPDKTFGGDNPVTRAQMATMIGQALGLKEAGSNTFKDAKNHWGKAWIGIAQSMGVVTGYPDGTFKPEGQVTYYEALSMLCKALGYDDNSLSGTWPNKYIVQAQKLGITENVALSDTAATKGDIAILIYNTLDCAIGKTNSDGVWKADYIDGREIQGNEVTLYYLLGAYTAPDTVIIGEEDSIISLDSYVGKYVTPVKYRKSGDQRDYIIAIKEVLSTTIKGDSLSTAGGIFKITDTDDRVYNFTDSVGFVTSSAYIFNGEATDITAAIISTGGISATSTFEVKLSGSKIERIYSAVKWDQTIVFKYSTGMLDNSKLNGIQLPSNADKSIDYSKFILNGVESLDKVEKDNVVSVYQKSGSKGDVTRVDIGTKTVEGKVTAVTSDSKKYTVDGTQYSLNKGLSTNSAITSMELGNTVKVSLDFSGKIAYVDDVDASSSNYAVVVATGSGTSIKADQVKLVVADGAETVYDLKSTVTLAGINAGMIVNYSVNKDGKVDKLTNAAVASGASPLSPLSGELSASRSIFAGKSVAPTVVVFTYNSVKDEFGVAKLANIKTGKEITLTRGVVKDGKIRAILLNSSDARDSKSVYAVINNVSSALDSAGDKVLYATGFANGKEIAYYTDSEATFGASYGDIAGDGLYELDIDADNVIVEARLLEDFATTNAGIGADITDSSYPGVSVMAINGNLIQVTGTATTATFGATVVDGNWVAADSNVVVYAINDDGDWEVRAGGVGSLIVNSTIVLLQVDEDSEQYDIILVW